MSEAEWESGCDKGKPPLNAEVAKAERNRLWCEENRAALDAYGEEVAREGVALSAFRLF